MFMVMHPECGKPAFYLTEYPPAASNLSSHICVNPDGEPVIPYSVPQCFFCGKMFLPTRKMIVAMPEIPA